MTLRPLTTKNPRTKAAAIRALKNEAMRGGVIIRRITRLVWDPTTGDISGLGHGTDAEGGRFKFWVDAKLEKETLMKSNDRLDNDDRLAAIYEIKKAIEMIDSQCGLIAKNHLRYALNSLRLQGDN